MKTDWKSAAAALILALVVSVGVVWTKPSTIQVIEKNVGAMSSPDILSPYFSYGGVRMWGGHATFSQTSKTACAIQTPAATSTIDNLVVNVTNGTANTFPIEVGWGTSSGATTTIILSSTVPASKSLTMIATSSGMEQAFGGAGINEKKVLQPNTWISFNLGTTTYPGVSGSCNVTFVDAS